MAIREFQRQNGIVYQAYFKLDGVQYNKIFYKKKEAVDWETKTKIDLRQQRSPEQSMMYLRASAVYLEDCDARMAGNTFNEKKRHLQEFSDYLGRDGPMESITTAMARKFLLENKEIHGNKAANRRLRTLKALWNWHRGMVPVNPWRGIPPFAEEEYVKHVPSADDLNRVLAAAEPWEASLLTVLLCTGARVGEVLKLRWDDVSAHAVQLWTQKRKGGSKQRRLVPISARLQAILDEQRPVTGNMGFVFINPVTQAPYSMRQPSMKLMLKRLCKKAGVTPFGFHATRHYFAVCLVKSQKADITDIQQLLGHQRPTTTDIYLRSVAPNLDRLAGVIEGAVQSVAVHGGEAEAER